MKLFLVVRSNKDVAPFIAAKQSVKFCIYTQSTNNSPFINKTKLKLTKRTQTNRTKAFKSYK